MAAMRTLARLACVIVITSAVPLACAPSAAAVAIPHTSVAVSAPDATDSSGWLWPTDGPRSVVSAYRAPAHEYGAGHRGIDIAATPGSEVRAPADGVVAFRGVVVDRALITIDHEGGYVTTFEPLISDLSPGDVVAAGDVVGHADVGGHAAAGTLHVGGRLR